MGSILLKLTRQWFPGPASSPLVPEEACFITEIESYYACGPSVSNFPEEFMVVYARMPWERETITPYPPSWSRQPSQHCGRPTR
jgi:hypothetical protein